MPIRVKRKREKGWKMPPNTIYVGRPTKWGNPFYISNGDCDHPDCGPKSHPAVTAAETVEAFRRWLNEGTRELIRLELRGKNLACWCQLDQPCHADVLLEIANEEGIDAGSIS